MEYLKMLSSNKKSKDLFETSAFIHIIVKYLHRMREHRDIIFIVIGDGKYPKCGFLLSLFFPNNEIISIDPECINDPNYPTNLKVINDFDYNIDLNELIGNKRPFFVSKHGHGNFKKHFLEYENAMGISMPCCCVGKQIITNIKGKRINGKKAHLLDRVEHKYLIEKGKFDILTDSPGNGSNCYFLYSKNAPHN